MFPVLPATTNDVAPDPDCICNCPALPPVKLFDDPADATFITFHVAVVPSDVKTNPLVPTGINAVFPAAD